MKLRPVVFTSWSHQAGGAPIVRVSVVMMRVETAMRVCIESRPGQPPRVRLAVRARPVGGGAG